MNAIDKVKIRPMPLFKVPSHTQSAEDTLLKGEQATYLCFYVLIFPLLALGNKDTIHQVTTMLATSKKSYFQVITTC